MPIIEWLFRLAGRKWTYFYSWMLNRQERHNTIEYIKKVHQREIDRNKRRVKGLYDISTGPIFLEFLKAEGLLPTHKFLDFGCGYGRVGVPLLRYLVSGNYVGVDLSSERIRLAHEYVESEGLGHTDPRFHVARKDNKLPFVPDGSMNFIWAFAVLSHMPFEDVEACLAELRKKMAPDGVLLADYGFADRPERKRVSAFWVPVDQMKALVERLGLVYAEIEDWAERISPDRTDQKMMRLTIRRTAA